MPKRADVAVGDLVVVEWVDATFEMDKSPTPANAQTVGWLTHAAADYVVVAAERFDDGTFRAYTCVPNISVERISKLGAD